MSIKPILFNTEMVRAILDGRKTQTRRVVKEFVGEEILSVREPDGTEIGKYGRDGWRGKLPDRHDGNTYCVEAKPPCKVGDILWVREAWRPTGVLATPYAYMADEDPLVLIGESGETLSLKYRWRPSIHMPRDAARIFLRVTDVQVERLNEISQSDAIDEGALTCDLCETDEYKESCEKAKIEGSKPPIGYSPRERFAALWDSTIKNTEITKYGWYANPWVWVITFERCEKPDVWGEYVRRQSK